MSVDPSPSIAVKSRDVRQRLADLTSQLEEQLQDGKDCRDSNVAVKPSATLDALERFTLWAGNMGAMRSPASRLSLDQRLSGAPEVQELVYELLDGLGEAVDDLSSIVVGESENRETELEVAFDDEGNVEVMPSDETTAEKRTDEATMLLGMISDCITSLFRTGILIRKAGTTDRFKRAMQASTTTFHPTFDIDYVREKHPKLKGREQTTSGLPERLGNAMSKRRQFIKYSRDHKARLAYEGPVEPLEGLPARTEQLSSKATSLHPERLPAPSLLPTAVKKEDEEEDVVSVMSASTFSGSASTLKLPRLDDLSPNGTPFECPICFTLQFFGREKAWRIHAFRDLKAYVCTVGGKDCETELFGDRNSWFDHEVQCHRAQYTCMLCDAGPFTLQSAVESHIRDTHGSFRPEQLQQLLDAGRQTLTRLQARDCPFCDDWAENLHQVADPKGKRPVQGGADCDVLVSATRFKRHVAVHQEQLAIFAIPRAIEESGTPDSGSVGSLSAVQSLNRVGSEKGVDSAPQSLSQEDEEYDVDGGWHGYHLSSSNNPSDEPQVNASDLGGPWDPAPPLSAANLEAQTAALLEDPVPEWPDTAFSLEKRPEWSCPTCSEVFTDLAKLEKHFDLSCERPLKCVFAFAGCTSAFHIKNKWKRHVISQHVIPQYWLCTESECARASRQTGGLVFTSKDLYTQHVRSLHMREKYAAVQPGEEDPEWDRALMRMQASAEMTRCEMPTSMVCPEESCLKPFAGPSAWDDRMEHVADHIQRGNRPGKNSALFSGGGTDSSLTDWATRSDVNIVQWVDDEWRLVSPTTFPSDRFAPYWPDSGSGK